MQVSNGRLDKAVVLFNLLADDSIPHLAPSVVDGEQEFGLPSESVKGQLHLVTRSHCDCKWDQNHPEDPCSHRIAVAMYLDTVALADQKRARQVREQAMAVEDEAYEQNARAAVARAEAGVEVEVDPRVAAPRGMEEFWARVEEWLEGHAPTSEFPVYRAERED